MKVLLASEEITNRPTEGSLVFLMHLSRFLQRESDLLVVHACGELDPDLRAYPALARKTVVSRELVRLLRAERCDVAIYVPSSGLTAFGILRGSILRLISRAPIVVIGLQERSIGRLHRAAGLPARPDLILSPSAEVRRRLERLGFATDALVPGFDERLFRSVPPAAKAALKAKYNLPPDRFIVLHVGHVNENRNLEVLLRYHDWGADIQPVVKAGSLDPSWAHRLRMAGIIVIDEYVADVHELYQAADCYLFPVVSPLGAVDFPLSIIEACAANLPVITTRFGAVPERIAEGSGFLYYDRISEIPRMLAAVREMKPATAAKVKDLAWDEVFRRHLHPHLKALAAERTGA